MNWTVQKETAARLLAYGRFNVTDIARQLGVSPDTVYGWKRDPIFCERIDEHVARAAERLAEQGLTELMRSIELRQNLVNRISDMVGSISDEDLATIKKSPISAINLSLRLMDSLDRAETRLAQRQQEIDEDEGPDEIDFDSLSPENVALLQQRVDEVNAEEFIKRKEAS